MFRSPEVPEASRRRGSGIPMVRSYEVPGPKALRVKQVISQLLRAIHVERNFWKKPPPSTTNTLHLGYEPTLRMNEQEGASSQPEGIHGGAPDQQADINNLELGYRHADNKFLDAARRLRRSMAMATDQEESRNKTDVP